MIKLAIVVFRECLEIAFLLGMVIAVTKPVKNSGKYIILGSLLGVFFAASFAFFAKAISNSMDGLGDEIFNSCVILFTVVLISWTVVWMQGYTKKFRKDLSKLSDKITIGAASQLMLVFVVAAAIFREGAEIILFVYSIASASSIEGNEYVMGVSFGIIGGVLVGTGLYFGLVKYSSKYIFKISTILLTLIAAGLAAEAAGILTSAGVIELFSDQLWDSSWLIDNDSTTGKVLNITIGYDSRPNGMQIAFYLATIILTVGMMKFRSRVANKDA
jgi:high-affinity iron transporter